MKGERDEEDQEGSRPLSWWTPLYLVDYGTVVLVLLLGIAVTFLMDPSDTFADELHRLPNDYQKSYFNYKITDETWPTHTYLPVVLGVPLVVMLVSQVWVTSLHDLHNAYLGHIFSLFLDLLVTGLFKNFFGQLRPDYLDRIREDKGLDSGRQSLPSGHASSASCVTFFLVLYLHGKLRPYRSKDGDGFLMYFIMAFGALVFGVYVGATRVTNHRHHLVDVVTGWMIGLVVALAVYCLVFYPPFHAKDGQPKPRRSSLRQYLWRGKNESSAVTQD